jgi:UDP-glucose 4-epimerase
VGAKVDEAALNDMGLMRVGITGAGSPLAGKLAEALSKDASVEAITALDIKAIVNNIGEKLTIFQGDIRDATIVARFLDGVDAVFHLAFVVKPRTPVPRDVAVDINVNGTSTVLEQAARTGIRKVIYTSSVAAYGMTPETPDVQFEDTTRRGTRMPGFSYAYTKGLVEDFLDTYEKAHPGIIVTRFRLHVIAGPRYATSTDNLDIIIDQLVGRHKTILATKPVNAKVLMLQLTHEDDLLGVLIHALHYDMPGAYNVAGEPTSLDELLASRGRRIWYVPFGAVDVAARVAGRFSSKYKSSREWLQALKYQCIVNCDKVVKAGAIRSLVTTRDIVDELVAARPAVRRASS